MRWVCLSDVQCRLIARLGLKTDLAAFSVPRGDIPSIAAHALGEFNGEDPRRESALESLCEVLFYERSVLALDPILADGRFLMGPFSETSMIETDRIFGINFARESLAHLQRTSGLGATMQKHVRQSDRFIGRNATKWFHAP